MTKHISCLQLANTPTPIHYWNLPGLPEGVDVYIKREDMTGSTLTGNKVSRFEDPPRVIMLENGKACTLKILMYKF